MQQALEAAPAAAIAARASPTSTAHRAVRACIACHASKHVCFGGIPCGRCSDRGPATAAACVERPVREHPRAALRRARLVAYRDQDDQAAMSASHAAAPAGGVAHAAPGVTIRSSGTTSNAELGTKKRACMVCHKAKTQCSGSIPCERCIGLGRTAQCSERAPTENSKTRVKRQRIDQLDLEQAAGDWTAGTHGQPWAPEIAARLPAEPFQLISPVQTPRESDLEPVASAADVQWPVTPSAPLLPLLPVSPVALESAHLSDLLTLASRSRAPSVTDMQPCLAAQHMGDIDSHSLAVANSRTWLEVANTPIAVGRHHLHQGATLSSSSQGAGSAHTPPTPTAAAAGEASLRSDHRASFFSAFTAAANVSSSHPDSALFVHDSRMRMMRSWWQRSMVGGDAVDWFRQAVAHKSVARTRQLLIGMSEFMNADDFRALQPGFGPAALPSTRSPIFQQQHGMDVAAVSAAAAAAHAFAASDPRPPVAFHVVWYDSPQECVQDDLSPQALMVAKLARHAAGVRVQPDQRSIATLQMSVLPRNLADIGSSTFVPVAGDCLASWADVKKQLHRAPCSHAATSGSDGDGAHGYPFLAPSLSPTSAHASSSAHPGAAASVAAAAASPVLAVPSGGECVCPIISERRRIVQCNSEMERLFGYSQRDIRRIFCQDGFAGWMLAIRSPPDGLDIPARRQMPGAFDRDPFKAHETVIRTRFGTQLSVLVQIHSIQGADGDSVVDTYTMIPLADNAAALTSRGPQGQGQEQKRPD